MESCKQQKKKQQKTFLSLLIYCVYANKTRDLIINIRKVVFCHNVVQGATDDLYQKITQKKSFL